MEFIPHEDHFSYSILVDLINDDEWWPYHSLEQQSHIILALLLTMTIFTSLDNHCHSHYLVNLVDLNKVRNPN